MLNKTLSPNTKHALCSTPPNEPHLLSSLFAILLGVLQTAFLLTLSAAELQVKFPAQIALPNDVMEQAGDLRFENGKSKFLLHQPEEQNRPAVFSVWNEKDVTTDIPNTWKTTKSIPLTLYEQDGQLVAAGTSSAGSFRALMATTPTRQKFTEYLGEAIPQFEASLLDYENNYLQAFNLTTNRDGSKAFDIALQANLTLQAKTASAGIAGCTTGLFPAMLSDQGKRIIFGGISVVPVSPEGVESVAQ